MQNKPSQEELFESSPIIVSRYVPLTRDDERRLNTYGSVLEGLYGNYSSIKQLETSDEYQLLLKRFKTESEQYGGSIYSTVTFIPGAILQMRWAVNRGMTGVCLINGPSPLARLEFIVEDNR